MKKELLALAADYGDERRSPLVAVDEARAFSEEDLLTNDPITVVVSDKGWVRAAKGHELDPAELAIEVVTNSPKRRGAAPMKHWFS